MTGFEPATTRPPDAYSNRTELHPELRVQKYKFFGTWQIFSPLFYVFMQKMRSFFVQQPFFRVFGPISIAHWSAKRILPQSDIEVVWTFMKFKICLNFWGVFGPWRRSVASYTTDERSKNGQKERWRLNLEEINLQIKSSSEKFRRLQYVWIVCFELMWKKFM